MSKQAVKTASQESRGGVSRRLPGLHARMRARRVQLELTGAELAQRAGISPSYVSLIEKGVKVPDEDVAAGLARALEDDEGLYRAWARAARLGLHDLALLNQLEVIARTPAWASLVESGQELPELDAADSPRRAAGDLATRMREVAARITPPVTGPAGPAPGRIADEAATVRVPVLVEGADPAAAHTVRDGLILDRRLVGESGPDELFAYEVTDAALKHLRGIVAAGDTIVLRRGGALPSDRICAVRTARGIVLARVLFKDRSLLLLPGEGESDFESLEVPDPKAPSGLLAGTHVLLIRR